MNDIRLIHNAVKAKFPELVGIKTDHPAKRIVQELLSFRTEGMYGASTAFKDGKWSGRSSFFDWETATFPRGFVTLVQAKLIQAGYRVHLMKKPYPAPLGIPFPIVDGFGEDPRYDYQRPVVDKVLRHGQIIAQVATGGGKSRICKLTYARIKRPTLFLTTRSILMYQMADAVRKDLMEDVGIFGDDNWRYVDGFNVGMVQTFAAALREPDPTLPEDVQLAKYREIEKVKEILARFELVIGEEAHEVSSASFSDTMNLCTSADYRLALTATPFMKENEEANMRLMAAFGPVAVKVTEEMLIERGILARPIFKFLRMADPQPEGIIERRDMKGGKTGEEMTVKLLRSTPWPKSYEVGVVGGIKRNGIIVYEAKRAVQYGLSVMVLVQHKAHGMRLQRMLTEAGVRCNFIFGEHKQTERKAAIEALKAKKINVLIGSTILDVGVDVPAVGMVIIASGGKAEVALRQRIGRGLREKKDGSANVCYIVDFDDWQNNDLSSHSRERRAIIDQTPGFAENVLPPGADFDFAASGFKRAA